MSPRESRRHRAARRITESRRTRLAAVALAVIAVAVLAGVAYALTASRTDETATETLPVSQEIESQPASLAVAAIAASGTVEVPNVENMNHAQAELLLNAAGLSCEFRSATATPTAGGNMLIVESQAPPVGALVKAGTRVALVMAVPKAAERKNGKKGASAGRWVVCIDPGHQAEGDTSPEAVGPGSKITKPSITGGGTGLVTQVPEYEVVLQISTNLKNELEKRGVKVVMTRTTSDVNVSNAQRARRANRAKADLFVRVHCEGSPDEQVSGMSTLYPASNKWTRAVAARSRKAAGFVHAATVRSTGAVDRGMHQRGDLAGFNWSTVPCLLIECGFLSHPIEDQLLSSPHYQDKLAAGMAEGIVQYLEWSE